MEFDPLLAKIANILDDHKIPYCVTGGYALAVWGRPRSTFDIDIVVHLVDAKVSAVAKALRQLSKTGYLDEDTMADAVRRQSEFNYIYPELGIKVDFFVKDDEVSRLEIERAISLKVEKAKVNFISPEDLILSKLRWHHRGGSERQLEDIQSIVGRQKKLDWKYLQKWAKLQDTWPTLQKLKRQL